MINASSRPSRASPGWPPSGSGRTNFTKLPFTIRDGVKWSDGQPMTADDVAYSFQLR